MAGITFAAEVTVQGGVGGLAQTLLEAARPALRRGGERFGLDAQQRITSIASSTYGPSQGRSTSIRSPSSYQYEVTDEAAGVLISFSVSGTPDFMAKFGALNFGSGEHVIPRGGQVGSNRGRLRFPDGEVRSAVIHPGTTGSHFYERAIDEAIAAISGAFM